MSNTLIWMKFPFLHAPGRTVEGVIATTGEKVNGVIDSVTIDSKFLTFTYFDGERKGPRSFKLDIHRDSWHWDNDGSSVVRLVTYSHDMKSVKFVEIKGF